MHKGLFLLVFLTFSLATQAGSIAGKILDTQCQAIPYATISLLTADSTFITGTITQDDGTFAIDIPEHAAILCASCIGYVTVHQNLTPPISSAGESSEISLRLAEEITALNEFVVSGNRKLVERHMDKIVMNVSASPFAIGNNGKDILKKAPGVNIDRKGKLTVNGKAVELYIDGRPSYLSGEQLKSMLEGTDGSCIDRVEIITQPSAKYDAAGQGGIINILTKQNKSKGFNGILAASYGGMYWRDIRQYMQEDHTSLNLNFRGKHTYTSAAVTQQYNDKTETYTSVSQSPEATRQTDSRMRNRHQYYMLKLSSDWSIDSVNTLGVVFSTPLSISKEHGLPDYNHSILMRDSVITEANDEEQHTRGRWSQHSVNLNYSHIFSKEKNRELIVQMDYNCNTSNTHTHNRSIYTRGDLSETESETTNNHQTNILNARMDFETDFWSTGKIECGSKYLATKTNYDSTYTHTEYIAALYLTVGKQFGAHWSTKIGLRGEYTYSTGTWADSIGCRSYFNLFPTVYIGYMPTEDWSISLDYTRRIQRPNYTMLDPTIQIEDAHSIRVGNPHLKPALTHNLLASFGYSEYISLDFDFAHTTNLMDYQTCIQPDGIRVSQATNYGTNTQYGLHLSLTEVPIVREWLFLTAQIGGMHERIRSYDEQINTRHWSADLYTELNLHLPRDWTLSIDGFYATPGIWGTERLSAWKELNLAIKKAFPKQGLTLTARVNDIALSSRWNSTSLGLPEGYSNVFNGYDRAHTVSLGISYKFGTTSAHRERLSSDVDSDRTESVGKHKRR